MVDISKKRNKILLLGTLVGGGLSAAIFFLLDLLFAGQGTWRDAIVHDLNSMFSGSFTNDSIAVWAVYFLVLAFLVAFGAFLGIVFFLFLERFFSVLKSG